MGFIVGASLWPALLTGCAGVQEGMAPAPARTRPAMMRGAPAADMARAMLESAAAEQLGQPALDPARERRLLVYNAELHLVVGDIRATLDAVQRLAESLGGHLHTMEAQSIVVKVPADRFHEAMDAVAEMGELGRRAIRGADVTDQVQDLRLRLKNAEQMRDRLAALAERADDMKAVLDIERELGRVTETVETLKGKLQALEHSVAFSTITVHLNSPIPQAEWTVEIPFRWVYTLGQGLIARPDAQEPHVPSLRRRIVFKAPAGFVKYYEADYTSRLMSADGLRVYVRRHRNYDNGSLEFWSGLARRALVEKGGIALGEPEASELTNGRTAHIMQGRRRMGREDVAYLLAIWSDKGHVYTWETWGPAEEMEKALPALRNAIRTMHAPWYDFLF